jgi:hypothetical protein
MFSIIKKGDEVMDKKTKQCIKMLRDLVSDVQGAPFPGGDLKNELYEIWYEHAQRAAVECFEYLNDNFPEEQKELDKTIDKLFK